MRPFQYVLVRSLAFLLVVVGFGLAGCSQDASERNAAEQESAEPRGLSSTEATHSQTYEPEESTPAPDFERTTHEGETFRLSDHRGDVIVINFWATWCVPCRVEMPEFVELQDEYGNQGLRFVGISLDEGGFDAARPFAEEIGVNYPIVIDDGAIADAYGGVYGLPATFIVDRQGNIQRRVNGRIHKEDLKPILVELLNDAEA